MKKSVTIISRISLAFAIVLVADWYTTDVHASVVRNLKGIQTATFVSDTFSIDKNYPSMQGPSSTHSRAIDPTKHELIWLVGLESIAINEYGIPLSIQEHLCHTQVRYPNLDHVLMHKKNNEYFDGKRSMTPKWFTLVPGQYDVIFPEGFGIPMYTDEPIEEFVMAFNQKKEFKPFNMKIKTNLYYIPDNEKKQPMRALSRSVIDVLVPVPKGSHPNDHHGHTNHETTSTSVHSSHDDGTTCEVGVNDSITSFSRPAFANSELFERNGKENLAFHFTVPPGKHVYTDNFHGIQVTPFDTTIHHITAHLHPYAESIALIDTTTGKEVYRSYSKDNEDNTYVAHMDSLSSKEGLPVFTDHKYSLEAVYNNTTAEPIDAMAVMYYYLDDRSYNEQKTLEELSPKYFK